MAENSDTSFDVIIIGSGPGGYVAAIRAAQLGLKTAIVEKSYLGGICLNWGCIPTKALLRSAEIYRAMQHAKDYGLGADNVRFDLKAVVARSRGVSKRLNDGVGFLMKKNKITVIWGAASIDAPGEITVTAAKTEAPKGALREGRYRAKHIIIATGARPRVLPGLEPDGDRVWSYFEAMVPETLPKSLLVIGAGSGAIGIELLLVDAGNRAIGIEARADRLQVARDNAAALGVPHLDIRHGRAPQALAGLPTPDAVFIGGGGTEPGLFDAVWQALRPGGRLVANAVTLETEALLIALYRQHGGSLLRLGVERADQVGGFTAWRAAMPIVQWSVQK